jgi:hypothetical protein
MKTAHETAGIGKNHRYLGHFAKPMHINRGHNSDPMGLADKTEYKNATGASIDATETPAPRGPASYQGVTTGPKGPGRSKSEFIEEQVRRGKDRATAQRMGDQIFGK